MPRARASAFKRSCTRAQYGILAACFLEKRLAFSRWFFRGCQEKPFFRHGTIPVSGTLAQSAGEG
jgi:hypothetical protein